MKITILLSPIMNMHIRTTLTMNHSSSLSQLQQLAYTMYQHTLQKHCPFIHIHDNPNALVLRGRGKVIACDDELDNMQAHGIDFEAYFPVGPDPSQDPYSVALGKFYSELD